MEIEVAGKQQRQPRIQVTKLTEQDELEAEADPKHSDGGKRTNVHSKHVVLFIKIRNQCLARVLLFF